MAKMAGTAIVKAVHAELVEHQIRVIRGQSVMLDSDLATAYGVLLAG